MKTYRTKSLISGYRLPTFAADIKKTYVAIPEKYEPKKIEVRCGDQFMYLTDWSKKIWRKDFEDSYGRDKYWLAYFEFNPSEQIPLL